MADDILNPISILAEDEGMKRRVAAAFAQQHGLGWSCPSPTEAYHEAWILRLEWAAVPGFAAKYRDAVEAGVDKPGLDQAVISDMDIISWVQNRWARHDA
jgi:hypothetical protein